MAAPTWQTFGLIKDGVAAIAPPWPTHQIDDIGILLGESCGGETQTETTSGWTEFPSSPQATGAGTAGTRLTAWWKRATSTTEAAAGISDPGNHVVGQITTIRGCVSSGDPYTVTGGGVKASASTAMSVPGITTVLADQLIFVACSRDNDASGGAFTNAANASLTAFAERNDIGTALGNGGGFAFWSGTLATPGATGTSTADINASVVNAFMTIAFTSTSVAAEIPSLVMAPLN